MPELDLENEVDLCAFREFDEVGGVSDFFDPVIASPHPSLFGSTTSMPGTMSSTGPLPQR